MLLGKAYSVWHFSPGFHQSFKLWPVPGSSNVAWQNLQRLAFFTRFPPKLQTIALTSHVAWQNLQRLAFFTRFSPKLQAIALTSNVAWQNLQRLAFFTRFPPKLRSMCHCLYQVVTQRFQQSSAEAVWTVIGTVIFLRFINPAIGISPQCRRRAL
jgi:hypothetical protein